jgi:hypothetical protein
LELRTLVKMPLLEDLVKFARLITPIVLNVVLPLFGTKLLPFVNPAIVEDVWGVTILGMPVAGGVCFYLSLPRPDGTVRSWPVVLAAIIFLASLAALFALAGDVLPTSPRLAAFLSRLFIVGVFFGAGGVIGSVFARVPDFKGPHDKGDDKTKEPEES